LLTANSDRPRLLDRQIASDLNFDRIQGNEEKERKRLQAKKDNEKF